MQQETGAQPPNAAEAERAIRAMLFALQDEGYRKFQCGLMPGIDPARVIGVRIPALRKLAKQLAGTPQAAVFVQSVPHEYYEENNLHGFILEEIKEYAEAVSAVEAFLPCIDNWATCDLVSPKVFAKHRAELIEPVRRWMNAGQTYTIRYGIGMLMRYYLEADFRPEYLAWVAAVRSEEYYVNMMRAWFFATALEKQPEATWPYLAEHRLDVWTHKKTIQKALESRRISPEVKERLRRMRETI
jgi:3-methyladenine DNA glycosylase AlkD